jgi:hypothetical protein
MTFNVGGRAQRPFGRTAEEDDRDEIVAEGLARDGDEVVEDASHDIGQIPQRGVGRRPRLPLLARDDAGNRRISA